MEHILKLGDPCIECRRWGLTRHLRYFDISLDERILKCEGEDCLYPHGDEVSTDSETNEDFTSLVKLTTSENPVKSEELSTFLTADDLFLQNLLKDHNTEETSSAVEPQQAGSVLYDFSDIKLPEHVVNTAEEGPVHQQPLPIARCQQQVPTSSCYALKSEQQMKVSTKAKEGILSALCKPKMEALPIKSDFNTPPSTGPDETTSDETDADIPKARISSYFAQLNAHASQPRPTSHQRSRGSKQKSRQQRHVIKDEIGASTTEAAEADIRCEDVLRLMGQRKSST